jgi:hypothetical protein
MFFRNSLNAGFLNGKPAQAFVTPAYIYAGFASAPSHPQPDLRAEAGSASARAFARISSRHAVEAPSAASVFSWRRHSEKQSDEESRHPLDLPRIAGIAEE